MSTDRVQTTPHQANASRDACDVAEATTGRQNQTPKSRTHQGITIRWGSQPFDVRAAARVGGGPC